MFRKLVIFSFCFLIGLLVQLPFGHYDPAVREAVMPGRIREKAAERPITCRPVSTDGSESQELKKLRRQYDSLKQRQHKLVVENLDMQLITETERYFHLEDRLEEVRSRYRKQLAKERRTLEHKQICSEN